MMAPLNHLCFVILEIGLGLVMILVFAENQGVVRLIEPIAEQELKLNYEWKKMMWLKMT